MSDKRSPNDSQWVDRILNLRALQEMKALRVFAEEKQLKRYLCVSLEPRARKVEGISILPLANFLEALWSGEYG